MDYIALSGVNVLLRRRRKSAGLFFTSLFSSAAGLLLTIFVPGKSLRFVLIHLALNPIMTYIGLRGKDKKELAENWALTYAAVLFLGGVMAWQQEAGILFNSFLLQAAAAAAALTGVTIYAERRKKSGKQIYPAKLIHKEKEIELRAYWDSGNRLTDPYVGKPVCILERTKAEHLFGKDLEFVRFIPYSSLGRTEGLLPVCNADMLCIYLYRRELKTAPAVIGIAEKGLLEEKEYDLILHVSMLEV